jgi:Protein of unknown function (DUF2800)
MTDLKHAKIGPSSLSRVAECPGSVREYEGIPRKSSIYSAEGTLYHEIAADCLELGLEPHSYDGKVMSADGFTFVVDPEITDAIIPALDWLRNQPGRLFVENRVSLEPWMPKQFGTLDVGIWDEESETASIFDWKFGAGVPVYAVNNKQLRAYAIGFYETFLKPLGITPKRWRIIIEQPRCRGGSNFGTPWEITHEELMEFGPEMSRIYQSSQEPNAPLKAGDHCQFCDVKKRKTGCRAYDDWMFESAGIKFDALDEAVETEQPIKLMAHSMITPERRSAIVRSMGEVKKWLDRLHANTLEDAIAGLPTPGLKAVAGGKGDRYWGDANKAEALLTKAMGDEAFTKKLKTPPAIEKVAAPTKRKPGKPELWADLKLLIRQDEGKPALVTLDDERPPLKTVDQMFDDEDDLI